MNKQVKCKTGNIFPVTREDVPVRCPVCGKTDMAKVVTVKMMQPTGTSMLRSSGQVESVGMQFVWLQMPNGWAHPLPMHWFDCKSLASGLARCPDCLPKSGEGER